MEQLMIFVLSDSLGETGELIMKTCVTQFNIENYEIRRFPYVDNEAVLNRCLKEALLHRALLIYTVVKEDLVAKIEAFGAEHGLYTLDVLRAPLATLSQITGQEPRRESGALRKLNEAYFKRVAAIEFAVKYDDGKDPRGLLKADVVILGISRTSKTPLSMYLANKNIKVANYPLVVNTPLPAEMSQVSPSRIMGLTNTPEKLNEIRQSRLRAMGLGGGGSYSDMNQILEELDYADAVMRQIGCPIIDVSNKAIEETAEIILNELKKNGISTFHT